MLLYGDSTYNLLETIWIEFSFHVELNYSLLFLAILDMQVKFAQVIGEGQLVI